MEKTSSEISAEEMTGALSLEEKPTALSSGKNPKVISEENSEAANSHKCAGEAACSEENTVKIDTPEIEQSIVDETEENANPNSKFIDKDSLDLVPYIEMYVTIQLERNYSYVGFVHSIDPITHSVILSVPKEEGKYQTIFIPGTSVLHIKEAFHDDSITPPKHKFIGGLVSDEVLLRKKKIISWLTENRLSVTEEDGNILFGGITLLPPYEEKDICTTNPTVALEVQKIIHRMPADYQPK